MIKPLSFYVDKIINDLKKKGKQSKQKGWAMSDIVQEVENQLGKDTTKVLIPLEKDIFRIPILLGKVTFKIPTHLVRDIYKTKVFIMVLNSF